MKSVTRFEIDVIRCSLSYGSSPCSARLGETGNQKCYNTHGTCQDLTNFDQTSQTLKYSKQLIEDHIPSIVSYQYAPASVNPGEDMGGLSSVSVTFNDHPHHDADLDPYLSERGDSFWRFVQGPLSRYSKDGFSAVSDMAESWTGVVLCGYSDNLPVVAFGESVDQMFVIGTFPRMIDRVEINGDDIVAVMTVNDVGQEMLLQHTQDFGKSWTSIDVGDEIGDSLTIRDIKWSEIRQLWVLLATNRPTSNTLYILTSPDLSQWDIDWSASVSNAQASIVEEVGGKLFVGTNINSIRVWDESWTSVSLSASHNVRITGVAYDGETYVISGTNGVILSSSDATTWTQRNDPINSNDLFGVQYAWKFLATGASGAAYESSDGVSFSPSDKPVYKFPPASVRDMRVFKAGDELIVTDHLDGLIHAKGPDVDFDPAEHGTYWGKFAKRFPYLSGYECRLYRGFDGDETPHHFVIENFGFGKNQFTIKAKSPLKLAQGGRAQCPNVSNGTIASAIDEDDSSLTIAETGLGDAEYPVSGWISVGDEIMSFTRSGDVFSLTGRGQLGTVAGSHGEGDLAQIVKHFDSMTVAEIIKELLEDFAGIDPSYIPFSEWQEEAAVIDRNYSSHIAKPTSVEELVNELINQCGLVFWFDDTLKKIRIRALRPPGSSRLIDDNEIMSGTFSWQEQPDKRVSQVWTRYSQINPLEDDDDEKNFAAGLASIDADKESLYGSQRIRKIFSRWFSAGGLINAQRVNDLLLSRYVDAPRKFRFSLFASSAPPAIGDTISLSHPDIQDAQGERDIVRAIVTMAELTEDRANIAAEEFTYKQRESDESEFGREVPIDVSGVDDDGIGGMNARVIHDDIYTSAPSSLSVINIVVYPGIMRGAPSPLFRALDIGEWPEGCTVNLHIRSGASLRGAGGNGGNAGVGPRNGGAGGVALYTRFPVTVTNEGVISGGGGGGGAGDGATGDEQSNFESAGGGGGGGGAGHIPGTGGGGESVGFYSGGPGAGGSQSAGGSGGAGGSTATVPQVSGGNGGAGGAPGQAGTAGGHGSSGGFGGGLGGAPGAAVDGESFITWATLGTIVGPRVN